MTIEQIARVCHEANRGYCDSIGDFSQKSWEDAAQWQRDAAIENVKARLSNPNSTGRELHNTWKEDKITAGWVYGPVKDGDLKTHPCLVDYDKLPIEQRLKDYLFAAVVDSLSKE